MGEYQPHPTKLENPHRMNEQSSLFGGTSPQAAYFGLQSIWDIVPVILIGIFVSGSLLHFTYLRLPDKNELVVTSQPRRKSNRKGKPTKHSQQSKQNKST